MSPSGSTVLFGAFPKSLRFSADEKLILKNFALTLTNRIAAGRSFACLITNDRELRQLNSTFLGRDYPADVLSFPASGRNGDLGDIAISAERAAAQALAFDHDRATEICILMLHGLLHLTGLDHENDRGEMARAEQRWRVALKLPTTLTARVSASRPQK